MFKCMALVAYTGVMAAIAWLVLLERKDWYIALNSLIYVYWLYRLSRMLWRIHYVEFDDDFLYVKRGRRQEELMIPLENIKDVEIKTVGGVYRVELYYEDVLGKDFYFKPSLFYPLNYRSRDELVFLLQDRIEQAKRRKRTMPANALTS